MSPSEWREPRWKFRELADGWKELVAVVPAPAGVIEVGAVGLTGCDVRFGFNGELTDTRTSRTEVAKMSRPVREGLHEVAIQWRGAVTRPEEAGVRFLPLVRTLAEMEREAPDVAAVMKKNNPKGFLLCDAFVVSQPKGMSCQVYGIFTVDLKALASGAAGAAVIKQDFLVHDQNTEPPEITYYTGFRAPGPHRSIEEFCGRFGSPNYGCERIGNKWRCKDHHYRLDEFDRLPQGHGFREAIEAAIQEAHAKIAQTRV
jgi:hypothetical protein